MILGKNISPRLFLELEIQLSVFSISADLALFHQSRTVSQPVCIIIQLVYGHGKSLSVSDPTTHSLSLLEYFLVTRPPMYCHS